MARDKTKKIRVCFDTKERFPERVRHVRVQAQGPLQGVRQGHHGQSRAVRGVKKEVQGFRRAIQVLFRPGPPRTSSVVVRLPPETLPMRTVHEDGFQELGSRGLSAPLEKTERHLVAGGLVPAPSVAVHLRRRRRPDGRRRVQDGKFRTRLTRRVLEDRHETPSKIDA